MIYEYNMGFIHIPMPTLTVCHANFALTDCVVEISES